MRNYRRRAVVERCCWKVRHCLWSNGFSRMVAIPLTQLSRNRRCKISCKNIFLDLYNRSSAVDSSFYNQPQVGKPTWGYNYPTALRRLSLPSSAISKNAIRPSATIPKKRHPPSPSVCANGAMRKKTAEERFNTLARGWLAYPVTPMHAHLPPKSGCRNVIPRFAPSRRRATALFRNPVCKAQRSVPGFSSTPNSACRRYATSPPSIGLRIPIVRHHHLIAPTAQYTAIGRNRRRAV